MKHANYFLLVIITVFFLFGCDRHKSHFSYQINPQIQPTVKVVNGIDGGPARNVSLIMAPDSSKIEFVQDEVVFQPKNEKELAAFLLKYDGKILRDGTPIKIDGMDTLRLTNVIPPSGHYLIQVNLQKSSDNDFVKNMNHRDVDGLYSFSSLEGIKLTAIIVREKKLHLGFNRLMKQYDRLHLTENNTLEHPLGNGSFVNTKDLFYMSDSKTQSSGLGIGVIRAWAYLRYKNKPPRNGSYFPTVVAIIDGGYDLDPSTGKPLNGNTDYHFLGGKPLQINMENPSQPVSGVGWEGTWHGQTVFSVAAAYPRNLFGSAGTGGGLVNPLLIQVDGTEYMASQAVRAAVYNGAKVINMSFGSSCSDPLCGAFETVWAGDLLNTDLLQESINLAASYNVIVVAAAGNGEENNNDQFDNVPCTLNNVICVGAILSTTAAESFSGYGRKVAIWAPDRIRTTPDRVSDAANVNRPFGFDELPKYQGTSLSSPFVAGIIGLMKVMDPDLSYAEVVNLLQKTALPSTDVKVSPGYVNALGAVMAISPNIPPTIEITNPHDGDNLIAYTTPFLSCSISDPEQGEGSDGLSVKWVSSLQGELYPNSPLLDGIAGNSLKLLIPGDHVITATVTDPFDGTSSQSITIHVKSETPIAAITYPPDNSSFFNTQKINIRGSATNPSGIAGPYTFQWSSIIDGILPGGNNDLWVNLTPGIHTINLIVEEDGNLSVPANITLNITQASTSVPTAQILTPSDGAGLFPRDELINFTGIGTDPSDGVLADDKLEWFSSIDGFLGTGTSINVKLQGGACSVFNHVITLKVTNSGGVQSSHSITILVGQIC